MNYNITLIKITPEYPHCDVIFGIKNEAFPSKERGNAKMDNLALDIPGFIMYAIEDSGEPIGFFSMLDFEDNNYVFGLYLAIAKQFRNRHYGETALQYIFQNILNGRHVFGFIEALLPESENYEQRLKRADFYIRNNMFILDPVISLGAMGEYQFISTNPNATFDELMNHLSKVNEISKSYHLSEVNI